MTFMVSMKKFVVAILLFFFIISLIVTAFNHVSAVDLVENSWNTKAPMTQARYGLGVVAVEGKIYAIGGITTNGLVGTNEQYDPLLDMWVTLEPMPTARSFFAIATYQSKIYCIGGYVPGEWPLAPSNETCVNEVYDISTNSWSSKSPFPGKLNGEDFTSYGRMCVQAHVVDGKIFESVYLKINNAVF
jgi:N-acetylneuraminic acid mutarotase